MTESRAKGEATRKSNLEKRKQREAEQAEARHRDKPIVIDALRAILADDRASPTERLYALEILDDMMGYSFIPSRIKYQDTGTVDLSRFKKEVEAIQAAQSADN